MSSRAATSVTDIPAAHASAASSKVVLWHCLAVVAGATSIVVGVLWDISWHQTIGRDTFWTPAHMAIYLGGVLGGISSGLLVLRATFWAREQEKDASIGFWGFRGPLGAWIAIWGAFAMVTSAPFDDWWHNAYGLDVQILSPPHAVLAAGIYAVAIGALLLMLGLQNRSVEKESSGKYLFVYTAAIMLTMAAIWVMEFSPPNRHRTNTFFEVSARVYLPVLLIVCRASRLRWPATTVAAIYTAIWCAMIWILPLFPAQPLLAPIRNPVDHMVPAPFPLLLILPAFALDLIFQRVRSGESWKKDFMILGLAATAFTILFIPAQWFFAEFLLSPAADNWFFVGRRYFSYNDEVGPYMSEFWQMDRDALNARGVAFSWVLALISSSIGFLLGGVFKKVRR